MSTAPQIPGILTEDTPDPIGSQGHVAALLSAALQGGGQAPVLGQQPAPDKAVLKSKLSNYFSNVIARVSGEPTDYEKQQIAAKLANETLAAQSKAILEKAQATQALGKNETAENVANTKVSGVLAGVNQKMADSGYEMVMGPDGQPVRQPIPPERLSEKAKASLAFEGAKADYNKAAALNQQAQADVRNNPNSPGFRQKADQIAAQLAMAKQKLLLAVTSQNRQDAQFQINNGVKPDGSPATIQGAGQAVGDNGAPIGRNFQGINTPTAASRGAADQAAIIKDAGTNLKAQIDQNRDKMGNMDSILNTAFLGSPASDPASSKLASSIASFAALNPRMHGFRGSQALAEFKKLLGNNYNNPDSVKAAIDGIMETANSVQKVGTPKTNVNSGKPTHIFIPGKGIVPVGQ